VPEFCPSVSFEEGVRRCVTYVLSHPECQEDDPEFDHWCDRVIEAQEAAKREMRNEK
jgi:hypothetical protein